MSTDTFLALLVLAVIMVMVIRNMERIPGAFREIQVAKSAEAYRNQLFGEIGNVRSRIAALKQQFTSCSGPSARWDAIVGFHVRNAVAAVAQFNPAAALASYNYAEEAARACIAELD